MSAVSEWVLVPNPEYTGEPRIMEPACHDRTAFITMGCPSCGLAMHMHESQIAGVPADVEIEARCPECRGASIVTGRFVRGAFQQMREDGWIA